MPSAVGGDLRAERVQPPGVALPGGGDHPHAAQQGDLPGRVADRGAAAVDQHRPARLRAEQ